MLRQALCNLGPDIFREIANNAKKIWISPSLQFFKIWNHLGCSAPLVHKTPFYVLKEAQYVSMCRKITKIPIWVVLLLALWDLGLCYFSKILPINSSPSSLYCSYCFPSEFFVFSLWHKFQKLKNKVKCKCVYLAER